MTKSIYLKGVFAARARKLFGYATSGPGRTRYPLAVAIPAVISIFTTVLAMPSNGLADDPEIRTFTVDVAFGSVYAQNSVDPAKTAQNPAAFSPGDTFVQDANIYPGGTIPSGPSNFDPEAPGAIGKYRARGTWTTDLANFERAVAKDPTAAHDLGFVTEMFTFLSDRAMILTDGTLPNSLFSAHRAVLGGTGRFVGIVGEVHERNIGENKLGVCDLRVTFKLRHARKGDGQSLSGDGISGDSN